MIVRQTGVFRRRVEKMRRQEKEALDGVVKQIMADPSIGALKVGDLAGIRVYKYRLNQQQYLVAYQYVDSELLLTFIEHGAHENFYRDLKR